MNYYNNSTQKVIALKLTEPHQNTFQSMLILNKKKKMSKKSIEDTHFQIPSTYSLIKKPLQPKLLHHIIVKEYQNELIERGRRYKNYFETFPIELKQEFEKSKKVNAKYINHLLKERQSKLQYEQLMKDHFVRNTKQVCYQNFKYRVIMENQNFQSITKVPLYDQSDLLKILKIKFICLEADIQKFEDISKQIKASTQQDDGYTSNEEVTYKKYDSQQRQKQLIKKVIKEDSIEFSNPPFTENNEFDLQKQIRQNYLESFQNQNEINPEKFTNFEHIYEFCYKPQRKRDTKSQRRVFGHSNNIQKNENVIKIPNRNFSSLPIKQKYQSSHNFLDVRIDKNKPLRLNSKKKQELKNHMSRNNLLTPNLQSYAFKRSKQKLAEKKSEQKVSGEEKNQIRYPFKIQKLLVLSESSSKLVYGIDSIGLKEITVQFLSDRRKYSENSVAIIVPSRAVISREQKTKAIKVVQIINALGGQCWIEQESHENVNQIQSIQTLMGTFLTGFNTKKVIQKYLEIKKHFQIEDQK